MSEYSAYIGLDVHKDTIAVAVALPGRLEPVYRGELAHRRGSLRRLIGVVGQTRPTRICRIIRSRLRPDWSHCFAFADHRRPVAATAVG